MSKLFTTKGHHYLMRKQSGSVHFIIVVILVTALLGALGFIFWQNFLNKKTDTKTSDKGVSKVVTEVKKDKKPPRSASWLAYESQNKKYSIALPDGWSLASQRGDDNIIAWTSDKIQYTEGTKAKVEVIDGGRDGSSTAFYLLYNYKINEGTYLSPELKKVTSFTTSQGINVDKFTRTQQAQDSGMDIPYGTQEFTYDLYKGDTRVHIVHNVLKGEAEHTSIIEEMIDTFKFL